MPFVGEYICQDCGGKRFKRKSLYKAHKRNGVVCSTILFLTGLGQKYAILQQVWLCVQKISTILQPLRIHMSALKEEITEFSRLILQHFPKLHEKQKVHQMMCHLISHIIKFGHPRLYSNERFETKNGEIKKNIQFTNRNNLSKDVLTKVQRKEWFDHIVRGGYWNESGNMMSASPTLIRIFREILGPSPNPLTCNETFGNRLRTPSGLVRPNAGVEINGSFFKFLGIQNNRIVVRRLIPQDIPTIFRSSDEEEFISLDHTIRRLGLIHYCNQECQESGYIDHHHPFYLISPFTRLTI